MENNFSPNINYSYGNAESLLFCVKCNASMGVKERVFSHSRTSPVAFLSFLLGPVIALIVLALTSHSHVLGLPLCNRCWNRYRLASWLSGISILLFIASLGGGVWMMLQFGSGHGFWPLPMLATAIMGILFYWKQSSAPRVIQSNKAKIVIDGGYYGEIIFEYRATVTATRRFGS